VKIRTNMDLRGATVSCNVIDQFRVEERRTDMQDVPVSDLSPLPGFLARSGSI